MYAAGDPAREDEESLLPFSAPEKPADTGLFLWGLGAASLRRSSLRRAASRCLEFLRPSFLRRTGPGPDASSGPPRKKLSTEYLDGVRGAASLIVFVLHWSHIPYPAVNSGWGYGGQTSLWLLPFVRLVYSGAAMVAVFFVVSGFVLSHRFVRRMRAGEQAELAAGLTSLTFRRAARLFLPALASSALAYAGAGLGVVAVPRTVDGRPFEHGPAAFLDYLDRESNPWDWQADFLGFYNPQLWSVAVELRGSMVVFLLLLGLARTRAAVRLAVELLLVVHSFAHKRWDVALFIAGVVLAELEVLLQELPSSSSSSSSSSPPPSGRRGRSRLVSALLVVVLVVGVFLTGYPRDHNTKTPGYMWSRHVWPFTAYRRRFWLAVGAILTVGPMVFLPSVQAVFLTRPARYLGRISFALYLVHGLGNRTIGKWLLNGCWDYIGKDGFWPYTASFVVSTTLYFPIIVWLSDIFWRAVDVPSIDFARWLEKQCAAR
ncbi:acyltransferase family-domain-containing protein [Xylariaceae sp. FL0804]|nr:acyltransferase family-domain-containing protein [Xylariaceae sp. FL0804]